MANANTETRGRGRPATLATAKQRAAALRAIGTEDAPSRHIQQQLAEMGLVEFEPVRTGARGRPQLNTVVTGRGRSLLALARRWK